MKKYSLLYCVVAALLFTVTILAGCDDEVPASEKQTNLLLAGQPWVIENLTVDGVDKTNLYPSLKLTFAKQTYSSEGGEPVWPASNTWSYTNATATAFTRGDGVEVLIESVTSSSLVLKLSWDETTIGGGRGESIEGDHVFTFSR